LARILVFAPRRKATEEMAQAIANAESIRDPLSLSPQQEALAGKRLSKLLRSRVAYHHSGLSYAVRAGLIEPLAKAGQLNVVVATMGLAAGINLSMRSVLVTDTRYLAGNFERQVQPDELLQMFGRAGRRGLDDTGFVLFAPDQPRLSFARPRQLKRATQVDWPSLISVMAGFRSSSLRLKNRPLLCPLPQGEEDPAVAGSGEGEPRTCSSTSEEVPFAAAAQLSRSLFSVQKVPLGVEHSLATGPMPCGLWVDAERARFVRRPIIEMLNSRGAWEPLGPKVEASLGEVLLRNGNRWQPALRSPKALDRFPVGNLCRLKKQKIYGREIPLATVAAESEALQLVKPVRKALRRKSIREDELDSLVQEHLPQWSGGGFLSEFVRRGNLVSARIDFSKTVIHAMRDSFGRALIDPPQREALPFPCRGCPQLEHDQTVEIENSPAYAWRRLGLVEPDGTPTRRGIVFGFFQAGEGLGIAAALEDESYSIDDLAFDLANLRAGPRFAGEHSPLAGRLGALCQTVYQRADHPGYLEMGVPVHYGAGASEVIRALVENPGSRYRMTNDMLRPGDIERAIMEWRSLLRHTAAAPDLEWPRWRELKERAAELLGKTSSPTILDFPPLLAAQQRRS